MMDLRKPIRLVMSELPKSLQHFSVATFIGILVMLALPTPSHAQQPAVWEMRVEDRTFKGALRRWAAETDWKLIWESPIDFPIEEKATFKQSFDEALRSVLEDASQKGPALQATFYRQNRVLRIHPVVPE